MERCLFVVFKAAAVPAATARRKEVSQASQERYRKETPAKTEKETEETHKPAAGAETLRPQPASRRDKHPRDTRKETRRPMHAKHANRDSKTAVSTNNRRDKQSCYDQRSNTRRDNPRRLLPLMCRKAILLSPNITVSSLSLCRRQQDRQRAPKTCLPAVSLALVAATSREKGGWEGRRETARRIGETGVSPYE